MNVKKWIDKNIPSLDGKTVVITGATGGIGQELCRHLLFKNASLILVDRNAERSNSLVAHLKSEFKSSSIKQLIANMENINSINEVCLFLKNINIDFLILNAGAYSIPRHKCTTGFDNVFQINFVSPYFMTKELLPSLEKANGTLIAVSSIAHNYSKTDAKDIDFSKRKKASLVYGNAKRYLTYSLHGLFKNNKDANLAVCHPGVTFTGITAHYPKLIFAIIKNPMKVIFMKPRKACLSILAGIAHKTEHCTWIGPKFFNIWGQPKKKLLKTALKEEQNFIFSTAEQIYHNIKEKDFL